MASGTTFSLEVAPGLTTPPTLSGLPAGAAYSYVPATGVITLTGMPTTLATGASIGPISVSYTQPLSGTSTVHASIGSTTTSISDPGDNGATVTITGAAASLMGTVFIDNNQDGIFDSGDTVLAGATVQLLERHTAGCQRGDQRRRRVQLHRPVHGSLLGGGGCLARVSEPIRHRRSPSRSAAPRTSSISAWSARAPTARWC